MTMVETVLRWPRRMARAGLFLCEGAVETAPVGADRLGWLAENLAVLAGIDVEVVGAAPPGPSVLVLGEARLVPALAVLAGMPVEAVGLSVARLTGLGRAPIATLQPPPAGAVLLTALDDLELAQAARQGLPLVPVAVDAAGEAAPPDFVIAAARPATRVRVRVGAPVVLRPDERMAPGRVLDATRALEVRAA